MMWLTKPTPDDIERLAHRLDLLPLSYEAGLLERVDDERKLPRDLRGWFVDRFEAEIGHGDHDFAAARDALRRWQQFERGWLVLADDPVPIQEGAVVAYAAQVLGTWWGYGCRILRVIDEPTRFGFVYGTIQGHAERGEELFLVQHNPDDTVTYSLFAMSRPGRWFSWPGMPIARHAQGRFRPTSADAMRRAVAAAAISAASIRAPASRRAAAAARSSRNVAAAVTDRSSSL
jgi:uncharacterized protein (UPF0548 family)